MAKRDPRLDAPPTRRELRYILQLLVEDGPAKDAIERVIATGVETPLHLVFGDAEPETPVRAD